MIDCYVSVACDLLLCLLCLCLFDCCVLVASVCDYIVWLFCFCLLRLLRFVFCGLVDCVLPLGVFCAWFYVAYSFVDCWLLLFNVVCFSLGLVICFVLLIRCDLLTFVGFCVCYLVYLYLRVLFVIILVGVSCCVEMLLVRCLSLLVCLFMLVIWWFDLCLRVLRILVLGSYGWFSCLVSCCLLAVMVLCDRLLLVCVLLMMVYTLIVLCL